MTFDLDIWCGSAWPCLAQVYRSGRESDCKVTVLWLKGWEKLGKPVQAISKKCRHTHTHTTVLRPFFRDYPDELVPEEIFSWTDFMLQGKISEADTPTMRLGATPPGLISDPPPFILHLYTRCPSFPGLGPGTKYAALHTQWLGFEEKKTWIENCKLEIVSIAEPLQNRQHAQNP